ncbi:heavy-metal-associated domain-containing protein [Planctomyces sp. SH-PL14]|uniref:heavy-metal-associated domain-containing protein n=1 Tax=Planctomyces sp. SH-PL14 TaxID=1632864 RepID=UPI00078EC0C2|nr:heavy-metal-associated domain-containing protein [Planctomyces sp. SH-PL14]AMV20195.1 Heavy-metal-associated domain protein [Planctomyces sp. SH-PL14]
MAQAITRKVFCAIVLTCLVSSSVPTWAGASKTTVVTVAEMCGGCVKKINQRLDGFPGIATVSCDIKTKTVTITPQANATVSSRALWEAMDEIGKTPTKMVSPQGVFTAKP